MDKTNGPLTVEQDGDTRIIVLPKSLSMLTGMDVLTEFDNVILDLKRVGTTEVVVDFGCLSYFGSSVLEALLHLWKQLLANGGKMTVCNVSEVGREILSVSRFDTVWPIFATRAEAIEAARKHA